MSSLQLNSIAAPAILSGLLPDCSGVTGVLPLSFMQEDVWFVEQMAPGTACYNLPEAWRLRGPLDLEGLRWSLEQITWRHETLRTSIIIRDETPAQAIQRPARLDLPLIELEQQPQKETELLRRLVAEARRPFDLSRSPLLRCQLFRLNSDEHVLFLNVHHLVSDAWSQELLLEELRHLYTARITGKPVSLPELPIQYADFAAWQREAFKVSDFKDHLDYWQERLRGGLSPLDLPADFPRPSVPSFRGATELTVLPQPLVDALKELSRGHGATLYMTLLAAFKALLYRLTGEQDIIVGAPMAGRERLETERLIGFFVNTHALRTNVSGDPPFTQLLSRVRETVLGACSHQDLPLEPLLQGLQTQRQPGRHPLFQVVFGLQAASPDNWSMQGLDATRIELDNGSAKFDWTLLLTEKAKGLQVRSEYSTDLFEAQTIRRFLRHYQHLLESVVAAPDQRLPDLALLDPVEREQLLDSWNRTTTVYERDRCVHELFESQAAEHPQAPALRSEGRTLTYAELNSRANQLARRLRACGVGPEVRVGVCLERSVDLILAMLAILKAGGAYVPLDQTYPRERLGFMLRDTAAAVIITDTRFYRGGLPAGDSRVLCIDAEQDRLALESAENLPVETGPASLAYVIYTSGSSGLPKAAAITHRGVVRLVRNTNYIQIVPSDVFLQLAPVTFDASTFEIWGALLNGAALVLLPPQMPGLDELGRAIEKGGITALWLTAGLFHQMVDSQLQRFGGLRWLLAGGDVLSAPHVSKAARQLTGCRIINGYGPTENTTFTCCYRVPVGWAGEHSVPIGRPIGNTQVYVLDEGMQPCPIGIPGELYTGGDGLARGYLGQPELTAQKFVPNPLGTPGARLYRTGDLARWRADGNLEFLGRLDEQLKIRGYRVEPGEIEHVIAQHPCVEQAVVVARPDSSGSKSLAAHIVVREGKRLEEAALREFVACRLPHFMVPSYFVQAAELPLTINGKVDRRALSQIPLQPLQASPVSGEPHDLAEKALAGIWCEVLGRKAVGIHQNFFHVGGHSLLAMQVISRITRAFGVELPLRVIFESPTICGLAQALNQVQQAQPEQAAPMRRLLQPDKAADLLQRIDQLSDQEVEILLSDPELKSF